MDWSKAKTILIVGFIALNLFLGWQLYTQRHEEPTAAGVTFEETAAYLARRGWELSAEEPAAPEAAWSLQFEPYAPDFDTVAAAFFGEGAQWSVDRQEGEVPSATYVTTGGQLILNGYGVIFYYNDGQSGGSASEILSAAAGDILTQLVAAASGSTSFEQQYKGLPLMGTYVNLTQNKNAVQGYTQQLLTVTGETRRGDAISPARAVLTAVQALEKAGQAPCGILSVDLAYYAPQLSVQTGQMVSVWRVQFENGQTALVNAVTADVEAV